MENHNNNHRCGQFFHFEIDQLKVELFGLTLIKMVCQNRSNRFHFLFMLFVLILLPIIDALSNLHPSKEDFFKYLHDLNDMNREARELREAIRGSEHFIFKKKESLQSVEERIKKMKERIQEYIKNNPHDFDL